MSGALRGALWGEQLSHNLTIARANRALREAAADHGGTLALLACYQRALHAAAPDHPLHVAPVRRVIDEAGKRLVRRTMSLQQAYELEHDPAAILAELEEQHATARASILEYLMSSEVKKTRGGFLWLFHRWSFNGTKFKAKQAAEELRHLMLQRAHEATLDDALSLESVQAKALRERAS